MAQSLLLHPSLQVQELDVLRYTHGNLCPHGVRLDQGPVEGPVWRRQKLHQDSHRYEQQKLLEVLGSSFLKFSTSVFLTYHLGSLASSYELTKARERLVSSCPMSSHVLPTLLSQISKKHLALLSERVSWCRQEKDRHRLARSLQVWWSNVISAQAAWRGGLV